MHRAEDAVAPVITPMIEGRPAELTTGQQLAIASWAALKAAVFEYVWDHDPVLTTADRELIMTQDRPPATVQVRLAAIESDGYPLQARGLAYLVRETGAKIMCLTTTIGCLVIQVSGGPGAGTDALRSTGRTGPDFAAIFPPQAQPARWPPPAVLGHETLSAFADPLAALADRSR
jgi:hypothetical protein